MKLKSLILSGLIISAFAFSFGRHGGSRGKGYGMNRKGNMSGNMHGSMMYSQGIGYLFNQIKLTKAQEKKLDDIDKSFDNKFKPVKKKMDVIFDKITKVKVKNNKDYSDFKKLQDDKHNIMLQFRKLKREKNDKYISILTSKQKKELYSLIGSGNNCRGNKRNMRNNSWRK